MSAKRHIVAVALAALVVLGSNAHLVRAQTPVGPREEPVTAAIAGGQLSGTLLLQAGAGPFPVALIVAGSGATDRDGNSVPSVSQPMRTKSSHESLRRAA